MTEEWMLMKKIAPDIVEKFVLRYQILKTIHVQTITGRRSVSLHLQLSERTVRREMEILKNQGLIEATKSGMLIKEEGKSVLSGLESLVDQLCGISDLEKTMQKLLGLRRVSIVQGDCDTDENVKKDLAQTAARLLLSNISKKSKIAITGGTTMAALVEAIPYFSTQQASLVVPARGSLGSLLEYQADTLAAGLAHRLLAEYRLLHLPDSMSKKALDEMKTDPAIRWAMTGMEEADILVCGLGDAMEMAVKRKLPEDICRFLAMNKAVAEALGYYFDANGEIVYSTHSIGISPENLTQMKCVIAAAGGKKKAKSIISVSKVISGAILIMDEAAAKEVIRLAGGDDMDYNKN